jgi:predicted phage tail protein
VGIGLKIQLGITDMKTVKLLGELGKKFGKSYKFDISNPAEAVRALCINFPAFKKHLIDSEKRGVAYRVIVGKEDQKLEDLHNPSGKDVIKFVPILIGAGGNGSVNTSAQGYPVPVGYGRMIVGSAVISAGIVAEELA